MKIKRLICLALVSIGAVVIVLWMSFFFRKKEQERKPEELLIAYMNYIAGREYGEMYAMLHKKASGMIGQEEFVKRNSAIYEGIEMRDMTVKGIAYEEDRQMVTYETSFDTVAGEIHFKNEAHFVKGEKGYELVWDDSLIFPDLDVSDKVRVCTTQAARGSILDRNGRLLAGKGVASSVGIVPGKMRDRKETVQKIAALLNIKQETIEKKLSEQWVKEDSYVPIQIIPKVKESDLLSLKPKRKAREEWEKHESLLKIPGVKISDTEVREYPLGKAAAHLIGYVQSVTAEDLEEHAGEGYSVDSVIGRSGAEGLFEKELRGQTGCRIFIEDAGGYEKKEIASVSVRHGQDIMLTIDAGLQTSLYEQYKDDKSCSAAIDPRTGEVLALVSTPSYDNNEFIMGLSEQKWAALNENKKKPMYNRFRQVWCPGSSFKPIIAAIGLDCGAINPKEDFGKEGLRWQKDSSWGAYYVTTLHTYAPVILENALIYSDNIYFAKAALKIGAEQMEESLLRLGFQEELPFEVKMQKSQFSNEEHIETEVQLADSGYGQGQILINPLHMACIYSAFCNNGNVVKPVLVYNEHPEVSYWIPQAFTGKAAGRVLEGLKKVVSDPHGTGYAARRKDIILAGKTGTAEIKASKEDNSGTELGWFSVFTADPKTRRPFLIVSMVEDVKERGGSGYVVGKTGKSLDKWLEEM